MRRLVVILLAWLCMGQATGVGVGAPFHSAWRGGGANPTFHLDYDNPAQLASVDRLSSDLTINGTTVSPTFVYYGGDASGSGWTAATGDNLDFVSAGTDPTYNAGSPLLGATNDDSVDFNAGDYFAEASAGSADVTTEDLVFEIVFQAAGSGTNGLMGNQDQTSPFPGWHVFENGGKLRGQIDAGAAQGSFDTAALDAGVYYHAFGCVNRDEASTSGATWNLNGASSGSGVDLSAAAGTLTSTKKLTLGALEDGGSKAGSAIAYAAFYVQSSWHASGATGKTDCTTAAKKRFAQLTGHYPIAADGTATPLVMTRAATKLLRKYDGVSVTELFEIGDNWPAVEELSDGTIQYLSEPASTGNLIVQSQDVGTSWTEMDAGDTQSLNSVADPLQDGSSLADGNIGDATDGVHGFTQAVTLTAATYTLGAFFKKGDQDFAYLEDQTVANTQSWVDLTDCTAGTIGSAATAFLENYGSMCRFSIAFTGTAASHTLAIGSAAADNDETFAGDASTVNTSFWGMMVEKADTPRSPIMTTTGAVARVADTMTYDVPTGSLDAEMSIVYTATCPAGVEVVGPYMVSVTDGGHATDALLTFISAGGGQRIGSDGLTNGSGVFDTTDGTSHTVVSSYIAGTSVTGYGDGTEIYEDTSSIGTLTDGDELDIGGYPATNTLQPACGFTEVCLWDAAGNLECN